MIETLLAVFAKYWEPGQVKTRLAASVGNERAAAYYRKFLATTLRRFESVADTRMVVFTPANRRDDFTALAGPAWELMPQCDGDLGNRLRSFLEATLNRVARRVVILGADSPTLPLEYVQEALGRLATHSVVLGPSEDGGYYLLGASGAVPPIFDNMPWSDSTLLEATLDRLCQRDVASHLLGTWYDVDDAESLARYLAAERADVGQAKQR
ncbi:MAG: glycosyltransferase [Planctomycetota bacterium]|nr:MAG: glycosyltransferase [Planctomycetota bacterium]